MPNHVLSSSWSGVWSLSVCLSMTLSVGVAAWLVGLPPSAWAAKAAPVGRGKPAQPAVPAAMAPQVPAGNPLLGRDKIDSERCQECHGADGQGAGHANGPEGKFAKLAGQDAAYVLKQMQDFRSGARKHDQMAIMARSVSDEDVRDIAAHFASLAPMRGEPVAGAAAQALAQRGQHLFAQGDAARGVPACASCHGAAGEGNAALRAPRIAGQEWRYLDKQLRDWRSGERRNSPDGAMNQALSRLSDADIDALTQHLASLPAPHPSLSTAFQEQHR